MHLIETHLRWGPEKRREQNNSDHGQRGVHCRVKNVLWFDCQCVQDTLFTKVSRTRYVVHVRACLASILGMTVMTPLRIS